MKKSNLLRSIIYAVILLALSLWLFTVEVGTVATGSMIPNINIGESVVYSKIIPLDSVDKGDIVVYQQAANFPVVHRVYELQYVLEDGHTVRKLRMKGDNNLNTDAVLVDKTNYVGKVFMIIHNEKVNAVVKALANMNELVRIGIALILLTVWIVLMNIKERKYIREEIQETSQTEEFNGGNLEIKDLDESDSNDDDKNGWFYL